MASTSASSVQKSFKYDVFLSFRGEDTRKTFVGHLYHALHCRGINTYKDDEKIKKGEVISKELITSIQDSRFYIIVFSKDYASSSWCLDELEKIIECQRLTEHTAYPVFYDVEPTHVRHQSGAVEEAFKKHVGKEGAGRWRGALSEAAGLAGWELKNTLNGDEAKFIQAIVRYISLELRFISPSFDQKLVGIETRVNKIVSSLRVGLNDPCMIAIKGIGGGGKTTLAKAVFDHISCQFEGKSFVENVSKRSSFGLKKLQKQILKDVFSGQCIDNNTEMQRMRNTKVLVVLDDVDNIKQLEALAGSPSWFKPGSKIIITTRNEQVFKPHQVKLIHDVNQLLLSNDEAICLFSRYAFGGEIPIRDYEELSSQVAQYAAGLPLTTKVLGSHLCGVDKDGWIDAIDRLKTIPEQETLETMELSYNGLEDDEKKIFLDVACILKGEMKDEAIRVLECCDFHAKRGLRVLEQKSLITISNDGRLGLHDRIEEMGKNIVLRLSPGDPKRYERLWIKEEIEDILKNDLGSEAIRCIKLEDTDLSSTIIMKGLRKMNGLRYLYVNTPVGKVEVNEVWQYLPDTLRSLHWPGYPLGCLPKTFQANKLVDLAMVQSNICQLWEEGQTKALEKLKFLDLKYSNLTAFDLGMTLDLEMLDLKKCYEFLELHMPLTPLKLKFLNLSGSKVSNPNFRLTPHLVKLTLSIKDVKHLPDSICKLKHLKYLNLKSCKLLEQLPTDIYKLHGLEELHLTKCFVLQEITNNICMLKHLKYLKLTSCSLIEQLPEDLGRLECLEELYLITFTELPEEFGRLHCLKELNIEGSGIKYLPATIYRLRDLCIVWSSGQLEWHGFTSLKKISKYTASSYVYSCE
ncbi:disease resistance protein RPV1 isoform X2 [Helianthus annuus]|uniref:disease resistance protein RPV1 isoform X2 n=1 Tax=Helianthus annuus TaxID=4232 RepID=UPI000B905A41|nr:disease resistance protein RPV1 isoform X2 [Helianthus annuus]